MAFSSCVILQLMKEFLALSLVDESIGAHFVLSDPNKTMPSSLYVMVDVLTFFSKNTWHSEYIILIVLSELMELIVCVVLKSFNIFLVIFVWKVQYEMMMIVC